MQFCDECHTLVLKAQNDKCRCCKTPIPGRKNIKTYTKVYDESAEETEYREEKGTKIRQNCEKCQSQFMYYRALQTRGADEGQTIFYECDCGFKRKVDS